MTYRQIQTTCPECKSTKILYDIFHEETFCNTCGLILQDNTLHLITTAINEDKKKEKQIRNLWRNQDKKVYRIKKKKNSSA